MFVVEQNKKIIFDMRHYGIYTADKVLLAYALIDGYASPFVLGEFPTQKLCNKIANEIRTSLMQAKQTGEIFIYTVPPITKIIDGGKMSEV